MITEITPKRRQAALELKPSDKARLRHLLHPYDYDIGRFTNDGGYLQQSEADYIRLLSAGELR